VLWVEETSPLPSLKFFWGKVKLIPDQCTAILVGGVCSPLMLMLLPFVPPGMGISGTGVLNKEIYGLDLDLHAPPTSPLAVKNGRKIQVVKTLVWYPPPLRS